MKMHTEVVGGPADTPLVEVTGNLDGQPLFMGRMMPDHDRGGFSMTDQPGALPDGTARWFWSSTEDGAIRWMKERKGL